MKNASPVKSGQNLALGLFYAFKIIPLMISGMAIYLGYRLRSRRPGVTSEILEVILVS
ncbi:MAG: hypothetical protein PHD76_08915 [Methylacidiphilales bacterium]|nr:hypothetical protein [Candidatus Methylacidiphilales bacterium]